jgi:hypothetical protein
MSPSDSVVTWARSLDGLADSTHAREFGFPSRSTEGGAGRIYRFADSSARVDVDDFGEIGRVRRRFYARGASLRLAVRIDERYDQPMSGNVVKSNADSTWFALDSAVQWRDSLGVMHAQRDSTLRDHGKTVLADYLWAVRMAAVSDQRRPR